MCLRIVLPWVLAAPAVRAAPIVHAPAGFFQGADAGDGVHAFLGIPYAEPPVGARRFAATSVLERELGTAGAPFDATAFGASCIQDPVLEPGPFKEDCLFLNVWTPDVLGSAPVLIFIHGGSFMWGSGSQAGFASPVFSQTQGVVLVTMNYRLSVLGFGAPPGADETASVNGLLDQRLAMQWVQRNIAEFGGDPSRVLLMGESAGAQAVCLHLVMPGSRGLFAAAALESADCDAYNQSYGADRGKAIPEAVGCNVTGAPAEELACLREVDVSSDQWMDLGSPWKFPWRFDSPAAGNAELPVLPTHASAQDVWSRDIPVLLGYNSDEAGTSFLQLAFENKLAEGATKDDFRQALLTRYDSTVVDEILDAYAPDAESSSYGWYRAYTRFSGDFLMKCSGLQVASVRAAAGWPTWLYHFDRRANCESSAPSAGVRHGAELPFVFGTPEVFGRAGGPCAAFTEDEAELSAAMMGAWAAFALHGDPSATNTSGSIVWPRLPASSRFADFPSARFTGPGAVTEIGYRASTCKLIVDTTPLYYSGMHYTSEPLLV